ncbi:MAG: ECF transporter S component [Clostridium sp.]|uniref:ECF transporter S component n=1 Tax=Clostridium sp. TaxID=1506 RepID=UPI003F2F6FBD
MREKTKLLTYAALLIALAIIIPIQFGFLKIYIPPFSATLAAHVPMFISMLISPMVAVVVGIGSTIGFLLAGMPMPVVFRASTHIIVGYIGAKMIDKNKGYLKTTIYTSVLHGGLEALVVIPFVGFDLFNLLIVTGVGGLIHHLVDGGLSYGILKATNINGGKLKAKKEVNEVEIVSDNENLVLKD